MLLVSVFFLLIPHVFSLNFSFTSFPVNDVPFEKSAYLNGTSVNLVDPLYRSVGRATYNEAMHLWDKATGTLTDFTTRFNFTIDSNGSTTYGDGMAFFLAPKGSKLSNLRVTGGSLDLIIDDETMLNSTNHSFVAVEFDIYPNIESYDGWDPLYVLVGVDINSIKSITTMPWYPNITGGGTNEAFISYNASTHNLSISFTNGFDPPDNTLRPHLHQIVDLKKYLPEWVTFGFSASTGHNYTEHIINTWRFYSEELPNVSSSPSPISTMRKRSRNVIALSIGLGVVGVLVLVCGVVWFVLWKNKKKMEDDESNDNMSDDDFIRGTGPKKYSYV